jgi:hypothetical protein
LAILFMVEGRGSPILLADCVDASGITQRFDIRCPHFGAKRICRRPPTAKGVIDDGIRSG